MDSDDLAARFVYYAPDEEKKLKHERIRISIGKLADDLNYDIPDGREKSIVMTKLEEAMMWANAALARNSS